MVATQAGDLNTLRAILALNPDLDRIDKKLHNVLHFAAVGERDVFQLVLQHCIQKVGKQMLYMRNNRNATPLHFACYAEAFENVFNMIELGLSASILTLEPPLEFATLPEPESINIKGQDSSSLSRVTRMKLLNSQMNPLSGQTKAPFVDGTPKMDTTGSSSDVTSEGKPDSPQASATDLENRLKANRIALTLMQQEPPVVFDQDMIDDFDLEDIKNGGSPLHWCKYRRTLEKLLEYDFPLNAIDLNHESALFRCVAKHRLRCMMYLLNAGADCNIQNVTGNTCLHEAVQRADIPAVQALVCWDCDLNIRNSKGHTARHLAASLDSENHKFIVYVLHAVGAKRCHLFETNCTDNCSANGTGIGKRYAKWADLNSVSPVDNYMNDWLLLQQMRYNLQKCRESRAGKRMKMSKALNFNLVWNQRVKYR